MLNYLGLVLFFILFFIWISDKECVFVSVGNYDSYDIPDLNLPQCGLSRVARSNTISFNKKCFKRNYENKTILYFYDNKETVPLTRIFNAPDAPFGESPWTVFLDFRRIRIYAQGCTGVLITFEWVLTTAHCYDSWIGAYMLVNAGSNKHQGREVLTANRDKWIRHPYYIDPQSVSDQFVLTPEQIEIVRALNDIALIKLEYRFTRHSRVGNIYRINPICLPEMYLENEKPENATFYGFGLINDQFFNNYAINLKKGEVILNPMKKCFEQKMFCANMTGNVPKPCGGDSGGPLVQFIEKPFRRAVLIGLLKGSKPINVTCSDQVEETSWTNVSKFIPWILKTMKENK